MKFAVIGMGGIGGFVGAMLVRAGCDVAFVARGSQLAAIKQDGLTLKSECAGETVTVRPRIITDSASDIGQVDVVFIAVKGYSLNEAVDMLPLLTGEHTLVLPLLNGVGIGEKIARRLKTGIVLDGLIYVSSYIESPGIVVQVGAINKIVFGVAKERGVDPDVLDALASELQCAGIGAVHERDIEAAVWTKFMFITAFGGATSYFGCAAGGLWTDEERVNTVRALCDEIAAVAIAKGVSLPVDTVEHNIAIAKALPPQTKSSLQRDLETPGKQNELEQFCGEIVRLSEELGVSTPVNRRVYDALRAGQ